MALTLANGFIPWSVVDLRMRSARAIWLATARPDGRAHAVPVWFVWRDPTVYTISRFDLQKAVNLRHQSWAVVHLGDGDDAVILEGPAALVSDRTEMDTVDGAWSDKYVDPGTGTRDTVRTPDVEVWRVDPSHVMTWAYGDISNRTDWRCGS
jgi:general stress protein 26